MNRRRPVGVGVGGRRTEWVRVRVSPEELAAIRAGADAAEVSVSRFVVERALEVRPNQAVLLRELFAVRRLLRLWQEGRAVGDEGVVARLDAVLKGLE